MLNTEPVIRSYRSDEFLLDSPIDEFQHVQLTGSGLLLVHNNNIYFANDVTRLDEPCYQITASGSDELLNGLTLATYRGFYKMHSSKQNIQYLPLVNSDHALRRKAALWVSPDSETLIFASFNMTNVSKIKNFQTTGTKPLMASSSFKTDNFYYEKVISIIHAIHLFDSRD